MNKLFKKTKNERGVILILTLLILSSILVVTLGVADLVLAGVRMNRQAGYSSIAYFASEAGLERALWEARKNNNRNIFYEVLANGSIYSVVNSVVNGSYVFKSVGSYSGVKRSTESNYEIPKIFYE